MKPTVQLSPYIRLMIRSLSAGRRSCDSAESISIPRNVMQVVGPAILWATNPSSAHVCRPTSKVLLHSGEWGCPKNIKSSK